MFDSKDRLFTFAVVSDSHVKSELSDGSAAWPMNDLSTGRSRWVVEEVRRRKPAFVIHLGDLVHPVPDLKTFASATDLFKTTYAPVADKMHVLPGNHDVGDKPVNWIPQKRVTKEFITQYNGYFGDTYRSFVHDDCHFILINSPILNSGLEEEFAQRRWLESTLAANADKRTFTFLHYPPFLRSEQETGHYDNIDEPARSWLLDLFRRHRVEASFSGHVHNFFYNRVSDTEFYVAPSTSFVRQDFSELFRIEAADVNGRNDVDKLGFFMVDVYRNGHIVNLIRSFGRTKPVNSSPEVEQGRLEEVHVKKNIRSPLGVYLRHPWAELVEFPFNAPMDEFVRKTVRNDYPLLALWEMGIRDLRVPLSDFLDDRVRRRMADLVQIGHRFTVFGFGVPGKDQQQLIARDGALIETLEIVVPWSDYGDPVADVSPALEEIRILKHTTGCRVLVSPVATRPIGADKKSRFLQYISEGFEQSELEVADRLVANSAFRSAADGLVFRLDRYGRTFEGVHLLEEWSHSRGLHAAIYIRMGSNNPAENLISDDTNAAIVAEAAFASYATQGSTVFLDSFVDVDRGYYVSNGLVDRRCNLRSPGNVYKYMNSALNEFGPVVGRRSVSDQPNYRVFSLMSAEKDISLIVPKTNVSAGNAPALAVPWLKGSDEQRKPLLIDLKSGVKGAASLRPCAPSADGQSWFALEGVREFNGPILLTNEPM